MMGVVQEWVHSWTLLGKNKGYLLVSALVDIVLLIAFGFLTSPVRGKLVQHVIIIGSLSSQLLQQSADRTRPAVIDTLFMEPVRQYTWQFLGLLAVLALCILVLVCVFQGLNWWLATSIAGKARSWKPFLVRFCCINLFWLFAFVLWFCVDTVFDLRRLLLEKATGQPAGTASIMLLVLLGVLIYFALISYPVLSIRKAFSLGIRRIVFLVPAGILLAAHFLVGNLVVHWLQTLNQTVMFVTGAVLLFVLVAWARLYIVRVVEGVQHGV